MSGFSTNMDQDKTWGKEETFFMDEGDFAYNPDQLQFQSYNEDQLKFQSYEQYNEQNNQYPMQPGGNSYGVSSTMSQNPQIDPAQMQYNAEDMYAGSISSLGRPTNYSSQPTGEEEDEPPLMEELGIDPDRIVEKTLAVLNPFRRRGPTDDVNFLQSDTDLAGPLVFCLLLAACLLFGGKLHFGYVYGLAVISWLVMYCLLSLMNTASTAITLMSVASVLGYCILPVVGLSAVGIFMSLRGGVGLVLAVVAVAWCSLSASRLFVTMLCEEGQRPLIAYPCALLYGVFAIVAVF